MNLPILIAFAILFILNLIQIFQARKITKLIKNIESGHLAFFDSILTDSELLFRDMDKIINDMQEIKIELARSEGRREALSERMPEEKREKRPYNKRIKALEHKRGE